jgi:hypothetical protein
MTVKEFQQAKIAVELQIEAILNDFNQLCVVNDFQLEKVQIKTIGTDEDRIFSVDILVV